MGAAEEIRVGKVLASKYRLEELLGEGGMGEVYRAVNELIGRSVAIKVLRREHASNPVVVDRFLREARAANLVNHPNVVTVIDMGTDESGTPFIVQELLRGEDLGKYVERKGGKLPLEEVVEILCPVIDAVAEAHHKGVIHRDIKPENVFLARDGKRVTPKLLDFGISKMQSSDLKQTEIGTLMGSPAYMPPELLQGARDADARSDVWAFGVTLFQLLSGRMPFDAADAPRLFVAIATQAAPRLVDIMPTASVDVSLVIERCLRRSPDDRYPSASELARDLRHVISGAPVEPTGVFSIPPPRSQQTPELELEPPAPRKQAAPPDALAATKIGSPKEGKPLPKAPSLSPPAKAAPKPAPAKPVVAKPVVAETELETELERELVPAAQASPPPRSSNRELDGVMMGPVSKASSHRRPPPPVDLGPRDQPTADVSWIVGLAVVGTVALATTGVLMEVARQDGGLAVAKMGLGDNATGGIVLGIQGALALIAFALAAIFGRRGLGHWRGGFGGGRMGAAISAALCGGALFVAIELVRAAW